MPLGGDRLITEHRNLNRLPHLTTFEDTTMRSRTMWTIENYHVLYTKIKVGMIRVNQRSSALCRFWSEISKDGPLHPLLGTRCWEWIGRKGRDGYGIIGTGGKHVGVHRYSWIIHNGSLPDGLCVLHHCDNPGCTNPEHLFLGTKADNMADRDAKGRQVMGEAQHLAKLTEEKVREIRRRYRRGTKVNGIVALAREFGVSEGTIRFVVNFVTWKNVI